MLKLSILICSIHSRISKLGALVRVLHEQIEMAAATERVEIRINLDNKEKSTGKKRQELLELATGEYVIWIDDDDEIANCYIEDILKGCESGADCLAICGWIDTNGKNRINWKISKDYDNTTIRDENGNPQYLRATNHITAVKRTLALQAGFNDVSNGEDKYYSDRLKPLLKSEYKIDEQLYFYRFSTHNKEYK